MPMATTTRTILTRIYDDNNNKCNNDGNKHKQPPRFFRQQPALVGCIPSRGVVGDIYDDDEDEDDNNGDDNEEDHCPCLFQKVLPMQSTATPTVRTTTTTSFYDNQPHGQMYSWQLADKGEGYDNDNDDKDQDNNVDDDHYDDNIIIIVLTLMCKK